MLTLRASHRIHVVRSTGVASAQFPHVCSVLGACLFAQFWQPLQVLTRQPRRKPGYPSRFALIAAVHVDVIPSIGAALA